MAESKILRTKHCDKLPVLDPEEHGWRHSLVHSVVANPLHKLFSFCLVMDVILVIAGMELQYQGEIFKNLAYTNCEDKFAKQEARPSWSDKAGWDTCNVDLAVCDPHKSSEWEMYEEMQVWESVTKYLSTSILALFAGEVFTLIAALGLSFFKHYFYMLDFVVIAVALLAELWQQEFAGLIIVMRAWRFFNVTDGAYVLDPPHEEGHATKNTHHNAEDTNDEHVELRAGSPGAMKAVL